MKVNVTQVDKKNDQQIISSYRPISRGELAEKNRQPRIKYTQKLIYTIRSAVFFRLTYKMPPFAPLFGEKVQNRWEKGAVLAKNGGKRGQL